MRLRSRKAHDVNRSSGTRFALCQLYRLGRRGGFLAARGSTDLLTTTGTTMYSLTVGEVMTPSPHSVGIDQSAKVALELMKKYQIRHLPVRDGGALVGVVTDRDLQFALRLDKVDDEDLSVADAYTPEPYVVKKSTLLHEIAHRMACDKLGCAIVTEDEKPIGIFTMVDACRVLAGFLAGR